MRSWCEVERKAKKMSLVLIRPCIGLFKALLSRRELKSEFEISHRKIDFWVCSAPPSPPHISSSSSSSLTVTPFLYISRPFNCQGGLIPETFTMISVLVESFEPFPRHLCLSLPASSTAADIVDGFSSVLSHQSTTSFSLTHQGRRLGPLSSLSGLKSRGDAFPVVLQLRALLPGGKGGFGSMLRSQGGKMSAGARNSNNDSCRDLNGRRLGVVREAKKLAEYLEGESERKRQMDEAQRKKYAKLEKNAGASASQREGPRGSC